MKSSRYREVYVHYPTDMVMPGGSTAPPPNGPRIPIQPINPINPVDQIHIRRIKALSKAKTKANLTFYLGFILAAVGMFRINYYFGWGMYGYLFVCGIMLMLAAILDAIFLIAKNSK